MKILFALILYSLFSGHMHASDKVVTVDSSSGYWYIESAKFSPDSLSKVVLYEYSLTSEGELQKQRLKIITSSDDWWFDLDDGQIIESYKFIDNDSLFIVSGNFQVEGQGIVDLKTRETTWIGGGTGELLSWDSDSKYGLVKLKGQKHYFPGPEWGAFWVDMIVNTQGEVIRVLAPNSKYLNTDECVPLDLILNQDKEHPKLIQSMSDCIYVER